eukprot:1180857-Prorocentrum_minimum.AAC.4
MKQAGPDDTRRLQFETTGGGSARRACSPLSALHRRSPASGTCGAHARVKRVAYKRPLSSRDSRRHGQGTDEGSTMPGVHRKY